LVTIVLFIPITLAATFSSTGNLAFNLSKLWAWALLIATRVRTRIVGKEKIKKGQTYIIISNHQSQFDILALVTRLGIQFRWIIKKELLKIPLFGYALLYRQVKYKRIHREHKQGHEETAQRHQHHGVCRGDEVP